MLILDKRLDLVRRKNKWKNPRPKSEILGREKQLRSKRKLRSNGKMIRLKKIVVMLKQIKKMPPIRLLLNNERRT